MESGFEVPGAGRVSALLTRPDDARWLYVVAHGAGAGMRHPFMERIAEALAGKGIATFRYQFPYMEQGKRRPDTPRVAEATVRAAVDPYSFGAVHDADVLDLLEVLRPPHHAFGGGDEFALLLDRSGNVVWQPAPGVG